MLDLLLAVRRFLYIFKAYNEDNLIDVFHLRRCLRYFKWEINTSLTVFSLGSIFQQNYPSYSSTTHTTVVPSSNITPPTSRVDMWGLESLHLSFKLFPWTLTLKFTIIKNWSWFGFFPQCLRRSSFKLLFHQSCSAVWWLQSGIFKLKHFDCSGLFNW